MMDIASSAQQAIQNRTKAGTTGSATVDGVVAGQLCTGCGLCAGLSAGSMAMVVDAAGFSRPVAVVGDDGRAATIAPAVERAIAAACPGAILPPWDDGAAGGSKIGANGSENAAGSAGRAIIHPYWGPIRQN
ncbi:MAG: hypothetical protein ACKOUM_05280, partial [Sphingopyxis sp.]